MNATELAAAEKLRNDAIKAINRLFAVPYIGKQTIDDILFDCINLGAVSDFVYDESAPHNEHYARRKLIKNHISMKLKEYIDGKL